MSDSPVPFLDLVAPHLELEDEFVQVFREALRSAAFVGGQQVTSFEHEFAQYCHASEAVAVGSGTDALRFALMAAGIGPGDAVITVAHTFIATVEAISQAGAVTEFVDVDERTYNLSPKALAAYLSTCRIDAVTGQPLGQRTGRPIKAVVAVHLYGQVADMDEILPLASSHGLIVIEDACQAHGAEYESRGRARRAGSIGSAAAFSFYPGKNLGACGEAGAVTTSDPEIARKVRMLRDHGQAKKYYHDLEGYNGRMDAIQAAFLRIKLKHLDRWNRERRAVALRYNQLLAAVPDVQVPFEPVGSTAVYHLFVIRCSQRDALADHLRASGISTGLHYPVPVHLQNCYRAWGYTEGSLPVTEHAAREILSLPMFPGLTSQQQSRVATAIESWADVSVE